MLELRLGRRQRDGELAQHLSVRVQRVAGGAPFRVVERRPGLAHAWPWILAERAGAARRRRPALLGAEVEVTDQLYPPPAGRPLHDDQAEVSSAGRAHGELLDPVATHPLDPVAVDVSLHAHDPVVARLADADHQAPAAHRLDDLRIAQRGEWHPARLRR